MSQRLKLLITTTASDDSLAGGLATHRRFLESLLGSFADLHFVKLGGDSSFAGRLGLLVQIRAFWKAAREVAPDFILINSPMFPGSCVKLLVLLLGMSPRSMTITMVFFHGGRLRRTAALSVISLVFRRVCDCGVRFFFLSSMQKVQFEQVMGGEFRTSLFANYSESVKPSGHHFSGKETRFLFVGRLVAEKGINEAVSAFAELVRECPDLRVSLKVCGNGPMKDPLANAHRNLVASGQLAFLGHVSGAELKAAYASSDVLVFPTSYPEGFPYVLIEAYEHALCVISTGEGALGDHVLDNQTGFILQRPLVQEIRLRMQQLASDRPMLTRLSEGASSHFQSAFSRSRGEAFYRALLKKNG